MATSPSQRTLTVPSVPSQRASAANSSASSPKTARTQERQASNPPSAKRFKAEHVASSPATARNDSAAGSAMTGVLPAIPSGMESTYRASMNGYNARPPTAGPSQTQTETRDNFDSLVDVMGFSGVNLRAEEEAIQQRDLLEHSNMAADEAQIDQDAELYLQVYPLAFKVHTIAQRHGLGVDAQVLNYLSIATRMRFKNLLETMIASSRHRVWSSHQHPPPMFEDDETMPMYHENLLSDPRKQLAALERAERGDEARRRKERLARDEQAAAAGTPMEGGDFDGEVGPDGFSTPRGVGPDGKRKLKKIGPGVTARNMSEDVQKRLANSTALRNLGGSASKYSWLQGGGVFAKPGFSPLQGKSKGKADKGGDGGGEDTPSRLPKPKFAPQTPLDGASEEGQTGFGRGKGSGAWGDVSARQAAKVEEERKARLKVTLRDALFALEYERSGGAGYGSGESVLYRTRAKGPRP